MIENLKGAHETVNFKDNTSIRLYVNNEDESYPSHWHAPMEIIMPLEKGYTVECCNHKFELSEGDIIIIFPYCLHTLTAPPAGKRIIFQPDVSMLKEMKELQAIFSMLSPVVLITPEDSPSVHSTVRSLLLEIMMEYEQSSPFMEPSIFSRLLSMFVLLGRHRTENIRLFDTTKSKQDEYTDKFMYICDFINEHCAEDLALEDVASEAGFSKYHFTRLFKQFTGMSFYQYLSQKRIATAEELLADANNSITEVALNSGFTSLSSFIRMFKLVKGCTPTEFRQMYTWEYIVGIKN